MKSENSILGDFVIKSPDEIRKEQETARKKAEEEARKILARQRAEESAKALAAEKKKQEEILALEKRRKHEAELRRERTQRIIKGINWEFLGGIAFYGALYFLLDWLFDGLVTEFFSGILKLIGYIFSGGGEA